MDLFDSAIGWILTGAPKLTLIHANQSCAAGNPVDRPKREAKPSHDCGIACAEIRRGPSRNEALFKARRGAQFF
jgi:hypothetical protein